MRRYALPDLEKHMEFAESKINDIEEYITANDPLSEESYAPLFLKY